MAFTVFYAWQSDRDEKVNHYLIRDAIQNAIDAVVTDLRIEEAPQVELDSTPTPLAAQDITDAEVELDWATKDEPGTPNVAQAIFRKISECGVFIADLTYVGDTQSADGRRKLLPNSNVLIELGQAAASVGWKQILLVMNKHFGGPEHLPFDLKNYAFPVTYDLAPGADKIARDAERKKLAKPLEQKLRIMQKHGIWTVKAEEERRQNEERQGTRERELAEEHEELCRLASTNQFHKFRAKRGILAVTIAPYELPSKLLDQGRAFVDKYRQQLTPLGRPFGDIKPTQNSLLALYYDDPNDQESLTEFTDIGAIRVADHLLQFDSADDGADVVPLKLYVHEPMLIVGIQRYLKFLRDISVKGPWWICISLLRMKNFQVHPHRFPSPKWLKKPLEIETIQTDGFKIKADADVTGPEAVARLLRIPLNQIWRSLDEFEDPYFTETGDYNLSLNVS